MSASSLDTPSKGVPEPAVMSNSAGRYSWPAVLAPGTYELRAETPDGPSVARVEIRTGATTTADLYFRPDD
ncbi:MAG: carboxypeptidase-like regulatory domain-containing protein [Actinomycetota bacterium]|nr:carboxypeptidase-like regulatory domain-containing protein [Actinomycetota bacterium]